MENGRNGPFLHKSGTFCFDLLLEMQNDLFHFVLLKLDFLIQNP